MLNEQSKFNIKIEGHVGTWYILDRTYHKGQRVFLLEHETYGEEAGALIVNSKKEIIIDEVFNGFDDLGEEMYIIR